MYDVSEIHSTVIRGTPAAVFEAIKTVPPQEIHFLRFLMGIRALPGRVLGGRRSALDSRRPLLAQFLNAGFVILAEAENRELVVGGIGQFWRPWGGEVRNVKTTDEFVAFGDPGYVKAAVNFSITPGAAAMVTVRTETRVLATDAGARVHFARYWRLIHPGSAVIRRMWLRAIRRRVER